MLKRFNLTHRINSRGAWLAVLAILLLSRFAPVALAAAFEGPLAFNAADFLSPMPLRTANYTIEATARNDGLMNHYTVSSPFGALDVTGDAMARERAREMDAIAAIRRIKKTDAFMNGLSAAIAGPLEATKTLITKPVQTIENLGQAAKEMVGNLMSAIGNFGKKDSGDSTAMLKDLIGYNKAKRVLAFRLGVDPYSSNPYLQEELGDLAWANFAGGATIDVAISAATVGGVGATVSAINMGTATGGLLLTKSLAGLSNLNSKYLADMGLTGVTADPFLFHAKYSVPHQTLLVLALGAMQDVPGRADYIHLATGAANEDQARFYKRTAEIMAAYHQQVRPVKRIMVNQGWAFFEDADGRTVLPVLADYMAWTAKTAAMTQAFPAAPGGQSRALWTTGFVSPVTRSEITALGIAAEEKVFPRRLADQVAIVAPKEDREDSAAPAAAPTRTAEKSEPSGLQNLFNSLSRLMPDEGASGPDGAKTQ
jgi:hypothetical protein